MLLDVNNLTGAALQLVAEERHRQFLKWGDQSGLSVVEWVAILGEEFGEVAREAVEHRFQYKPLQDFKKEVMQMTAVGVQILEALEINQSSSKSAEHKSGFEDWFKKITFEAVRVGVPRSEIVQADLLFKFLFDMNYCSSGAFSIFQKMKETQQENMGWKAMSEALDDVGFGEGLGDGKSDQEEIVQDFDFDTWFDLFQDHVRSIGYDGILDKYTFEADWIEGNTPEDSARLFVKERTE